PPPRDRRKQIVPSSGVPSKHVGKTTALPCRNSRDELATRPVQNLSTALLRLLTRKDLEALGDDVAVQRGLVSSIDCGGSWVLVLHCRVAVLPKSVAGPERPVGRFFRDDDRSGGSAARIRSPARVSPPTRTMPMIPAFRMSCPLSSRPRTAAINP